MPTDLPPSLRPTVCELAQYLIEHPQASDTVEGIARWWLAEAVAEQWLLQRALDWMKTGSLVEETVAADGRRRYRRGVEVDVLRALVGEYGEARP